MDPPSSTVDYCFLQKKKYGWVNQIGPSSKQTKTETIMMGWYKGADCQVTFYICS